MPTRARDASELEIALTPEGRLIEAPRVQTADEVEPSGLALRLRTALAEGSGQALLHLALVEPPSLHLPAPLEFFRSLGRLYVVRLAATPELETLRGRAVVLSAAEDLSAWLRGAPPFLGAEYLNLERAVSLWQEMHAEFRNNMATWKGTVEAWLSRHHAAVHVVGRVVFHLAENKRDADYPFGFLATYATRLGAKGRVQHRALGQAVQDSALEKDRNALLTLLAPVQRAASASSLVRHLVDTGALYQPLAWTAEEAHRFLQDVPAFEAAGLLVRVPDWWRGRRTLTPVVRVRLGDAPPSGIGTEGLLDFDVDVALEEEPLTAGEIKALLAGTETLLFLRGRWVEVDRERLTKVLGHWHDVQRVARAGVTFHEALRMVAGPNTPARRLADPADDPERRFTHVLPGTWLATTLAGLRSPGGLAAADPGTLLAADLRPYQKHGVRWLWWLRSLGLGGCLADDMGLGKTVQVIALLTLIARDNRSTNTCTSKPALLVVPASLMANWQSELAHFAPALRVLLAHPSFLPADELAALDDVGFTAHDVVITTYQTLLRIGSFAATEWDVLVLDEAQAIKNPGTKQSRVVKTIRARTRLALTGTPIENRLGDVWSIFDFIAPGLLGNAAEFARFTKSLNDGQEMGYATLRSLVQPYILRRLKTDRSVISDLPEKVEVTVYCSLTRRQAALYQQTVQGLARALAKRTDDAEGVGEGNGIERRGLVLTTLLRLKQICNHPAQWLKDGGAWTPAESGKLARLAALVEEMASRQEKALVFTQFREIAEPLAGFFAEAFGRPGLVLTGSTAMASRKKLVDAFQDPAGPPFFVISLKAGGTGLNLTAATHVIHFDRWWNPAVENQATDRAFRIGQKRNVLVHKLVCRGTVEERIDQMLAGKRELSQQVLAADKEVNLTELDDETLLRTLSLDMKQAVAGA